MIGALTAAVAALTLTACAGTTQAPAPAPASPAERMVEEQIAARGVTDPRVLDAMRRVPRHRFVPPHLEAAAYEDHPLPIGHGQTISQPFVVAHMTELLRLTPSARVLEIGTGSGYQAAVLAEIAAEVYTIEIVEPLAEQARRVLRETGYANVTVRTGDGWHGWPEKAPFDAIIVTAAPAEIPAPLVEQLGVGGRLVAPVGTGVQEMTLLEKTADGVSRTTTIPVLFVPFVR